jgi:hypothetical protein
MIDCAYFITAMLFEIPIISQNQYSVLNKSISRPFKNLI